MSAPVLRPLALGSSRRLGVGVRLPLAQSWRKSAIMPFFGLPSTKRRPYLSLSHFLPPHCGEQKSSKKRSTNVFLHHDFPPIVISTLTQIYHTRKGLSRLFGKFFVKLLPFFCFFLDIFTKKSDFSPFFLQNVGVGRSRSSPKNTRYSEFWRFSALRVIPAYRECPKVRRCGRDRRGSSNQCRSCPSSRCR